MKQKTESSIPRGPTPETGRKTGRKTSPETSLETDWKTGLETGLETDRRALRERLLATRRGLPEAIRRQADEAIAQRLEPLLGASLRSPLESPLGSLAECRSGRCGAVVVGLYWPIDAEPGIDPILARLRSDALRFALPVVAARASPLRFVAWQPGDPMTTGAYGIPRPAGDLAIDPDVLLVPCVGFDARCFRIGYGGGYYDRTLAEAGRDRPFAIGLAYDELEVADVAPQAHDIALDAVVTPTRLLTNPRPPSRSPATDPPG